MTTILEPSKESSPTRPVEDLLKRVVEVSGQKFVEENLVGLLPEDDGTSPRSDYVLSDIQADGRGSATIQYTVNGLPKILGKMYTDEKGPYSHDILQELWHHGFGKAQPYQVPEPLLFLSHQNLLLMRKATGTSLDSYLEKDDREAFAGVKAAARWLARFHSCSVSIGKPDDVWESFRDLGIEASEAAWQQPEVLKTITNMTTALERLAPAYSEDIVLVHGQFQPRHVYLDNGAVTAVSLDAASRADPAKDAATFLHSLRTTLRQLGKAENADVLTRAFLDEYSELRTFGLHNLPFYLALEYFASFCAQIKSLQSESPELKQTIDFHTGEFELATSDLFVQRQEKGEGTSPVRRRYELSPAKRDEAKDQARSAVSKITHRDFVRRVVQPIVYGKRSKAGKYPESKTKVIRDIGTGRVTVRYRFEDRTIVYGKVYSDPLVAQHGFQVQKSLWENGFDVGSPYRVPEPLAYLPEYGLVLQRASEGRPLEDFFEKDSSKLVSSTRNAAKWLVQLHRSPVRIGPPDSLWRSAKLFKALRKLAKASANVPSERKRLLKLVDELCAVDKRRKGHVSLVQTHGRFHHEHIFVEGETVSLIDLDGSVPSDPAKDLAELLRLLRSQTFKRTGSTAMALLPEKAFLDEYLSRLPENGANLPTIWGVFTLLSICKKVKKYGKGKIDRDEFSRAMHFYLDEFENVLSRDMPIAN